MKPIAKTKKQPAKLAVEQPSIWLNADEVEGTADCGCRLVRDHGSANDPAIFLCPLHTHAAELLAAAERVVRAHLENWRVSKMDFPPIDDLIAAVANIKGGK